MGENKTIVGQTMAGEKCKCTREISSVRKSTKLNDMASRAEAKIRSAKSKVVGDTSDKAWSDFEIRYRQYTRVMDEFKSAWKTYERAKEAAEDAYADGKIVFFKKCKKLSQR